MKKKIRFAACGVLAGSLLLSGCAAGAAEETSTDLRWSMWIGGEEDQVAWNKVASEVTAQNPDLKVTLQGSSWGDYWTKLRTQLSTGTGTCIVALQSLRIPNYADVLLPLDDLIADSDLVDPDDFDTAALEGMQVDGQQFALPYDTGSVVMFYNKDAFDAAGIEPEPGWTVAEFEAAAAQLKDDGIAILGQTVEDLPLESAMFAYNGGRVLDQDGALQLDDKKFEEGLDWWASLVEKGYAPQVNGADPGAEDAAFVNGTVGAFVQGIWSVADAKKNAGFNLGVTTLPTLDSARTFSAGSGFGISKQCESPENAFKAIATMTGEKVLTDIGDEGRAFPARTASQAGWFENADLEGLQETVDYAAEGAEPLPGNEIGEPLAQLFAQYGVLALNGQQSSAETMKQIAAQLPQ